MTQKQIRRFTRFEIIYHWCQAIPYSVLLVTGGLILFQRMLDLEFVSNNTLSLIHKITGGVFIVIMSAILSKSLFTKEISILFRNLKESLKWNVNDLLWLSKIPFNVFMPRRFTLPEMGRFNSGQKMHLLFLTIGIPCFVVSGILIIVIPGALGPWIIHLCFFVPAAVFIAIHLYLSLINPSTRRAVKGIFNGFVSEDYVRDHHPLCIEGEGEGEGDQFQGKTDKHHGSIIGLTAILITAAAAALLIFLLLFLYEPARLEARLKTVAEHKGAELILPGALCTSHMKTWTGDGCFSCHRLFVSPPDEVCLSCHGEIGEIIQNKTGFHGTLSGECRTCHPDHHGVDAEIRPLDRIAFNHKQARFHLKGKHSEVKCEQCHARDDKKNKRKVNRFTGMEFTECVDCHKDPHKEQMQSGCDTCHIEEGWKGNFLIFSHAENSKFKIDPLHSKFTCSACHGEKEAVKYSPLPVTCDGCHPEIELYMKGIARGSGELGRSDPHYARTGCEKCHPVDKQVIDQTVYAQTCGSCHNRHYEKLYFSWRKALMAFERKGWKKLEDLKKGGAFDVEEFEKKVREAKAVGFHNVQFATELWKMLLEE